MASVNGLYAIVYDRAGGAARPVRAFDAWPRKQYLNRGRYSDYLVASFSTPVSADLL
jgi:hypothetical protein